VAAIMVDGMMICAVFVKAFIANVVMILGTVGMRSNSGSVAKLVGSPHLDLIQWWHGPQTTRTTPSLCTRRYSRSLSC
jgi:hypothetical protein